MIISCIALAKWLNDVVRIPYIRMDTTFRDFISCQVMEWTHAPDHVSLNLHNPPQKVWLYEMEWRNEWKKGWW